MNTSLGNNKLNCFTLAELLIGMIVSGIILTAGWNAFHIIQKQSQNSASIKVYVSEISLFHRILLNDYEKADTAQVENNAIYFHGIGNDPVAYHVSDRYVTRTFHSHIDTFIVKLRDVNLSENNILKFTILIGDETEEMILCRRASAKEKIK